jgi:hypothetical protein
MRLPNALYSPKVSTGAIPPRNFPPQTSLYKEIVSFLVIQSICLCHVWIHPCPLLLNLLLSSATTYIAVSSVFLERHAPLGSRYNNNFEFIKMMFLLLPLYFCTVPFFSNATLFEHSMGLWFGAHFGFLDNVAVLQTFGMKIVRFPGGWREMKVSEMGIGLVLVMFMGSVIVGVEGSVLFGRKTVTLYLCLGASLLSIKYIKRQTHVFHAHHWFNSLLVLPVVLCLSTDSSYNAMLRGVVLGSCIEGISCWGLDPLFHDPLSRGVDFGTTLWTSLVPLVSSVNAAQVERYSQCLSCLQTMSMAVTENPNTVFQSNIDVWGTGLPLVLNCHSSCVNQDVLQLKKTTVFKKPKNTQVPNDLIALSHALKREWAATLAYVKVVVVGLLLGQATLLKVSVLPDRSTNTLGFSLADAAIDVPHIKLLTLDSLCTSIDDMEKKMTHEEKMKVYEYEKRIVFCLVGVHNVVNKKGI